MYAFTRLSWSLLALCGSLSFSRAFVQAPGGLAPWLQQQSARPAFRRTHVRTQQLPLQVISPRYPQQSTITLPQNPTEPFVRWYLATLKRRPLPTKMVTSAIVCGLGDAICQMLTAGGFGALRHALDFRRLVLYSTMGGLYVAPDMVPGKVTLVKAKKALNMTFIDTLASPLINGGFLYVFTAANCLASGAAVTGAAGAGLEKLQVLANLMRIANLNNIVDKNTCLWPTLLASWKMWPLANFFNFLLVPPHLRVLYLNVVGLVWHTVLSALCV
ncbi:hypothetical protein JKP88DRAFT_297357 [Tribonema minus]|uniref:Uncharacterized protein n=1 Tax=Tribonema minus TaxID=303371 RepID=A0A836CMN9_9STRA|nr:hypothetical protein JKP88DRAFT_297357 [Tribonema minus]